MSLSCLGSKKYDGGKYRAVHKSNSDNDTACDGGGGEEQEN